MPEEQEKIAKKGESQIIEDKIETETIEQKVQRLEDELKFIKTFAEFSDGYIKSHDYAFEEAGWFLKAVAEKVKGQVYKKSSAEFNNVSRIKGNSGYIQFDYSGRIQVGTHFDPPDGGSYNTGGADRYWGDVSYKTLTDRGCLGCFDDGVELQDGRIVSDIEAIKSIKKHPTKKTVYGIPMLDYKSLPKVSYVPAKNRITGEKYPRNENDEPYNPKTGLPAQDGAETTSLISIMLGAIKELDSKIVKQKEEIEMLKNGKTNTSKL